MTIPAFPSAERCSSFDDGETVDLMGRNNS